MPPSAWSAWTYLRCSGLAGAMIVAMGSVAPFGGPRIWRRLVPCRDHEAAVQAQSHASIRPGGLRPLRFLIRSWTGGGLLGHTDWAGTAAAGSAVAIPARDVQLLRC